MLTILISFQNDHFQQSYHSKFIDSRNWTFFPWINNSVFKFLKSSWTLQDTKKIFCQNSSYNKRNCSCKQFAQSYKNIIALNKWEMKRKIPTTDRNAVISIKLTKKKNGKGANIIFVLWIIFSETKNWISESGLREAHRGSNQYQKCRICKLPIKRVEPLTEPKVQQT